MAGNIAICATYFAEMLIAYIFFSQIGEKKYNIWRCCLIGTAVFEVGALSDIIFSNTIWLNALMFVIINFFFAFFCFNIKITKILFYSIILDIFSTALEFAAIFLISTLTNTEVTEYVDNLTFFIIDVSISKILYFITCLILSALVKKDKSSVKIPVALYFYPIVITFALILFWSICADYELSNAHQILLSVISALMFLSTVILFIVYQNSVAKENQYLIIEQEIEKINIDKKFYDILEQQNNELMIYAHDTKNHLNAIKALNDNEQIDEYLTKMTNELKAHSSTCHSGNHTLDVIINKYVTECEIKNISFDFDLRLSNLKIADDYDLVTILGNVLDNAVGAAYSSESKKISLRTNKVNTYDSIIITNSCDTPPQSVNRELKTTKKDKKSHGLGLKSVMKVLKKYKGDLEWEYNSEDKQFITTNSYAYDKDRLQNINVNGALQYKFDYDKFGRTTANKVGNGTSWQTLSKMDYNAAGLLAKQTYGNGDYVDFTYDKFDRQTEKRYNGDNSQRVTYSYGNNGSVAQITDYFTNSNTRFTYDLAERVVSQREYSGTAKNGGELLSYTDFTYADKTNYLTGIKHFSPLGTQNIGYTYGNLKRGYMPDQVYGVSWNGTNKLQNYYDGLGRLVRKSFNGIKEFGSVYTYEDITVNNDQRTTTLVHSVETPTGTYTYTYDKLGNITAISDGTYTTSYEYDSLNQLTRVNDEKAGKTYTYSYVNGNITECNEYPVGDGVLDVPQTTKTWEYNDSTWSDLLTNYNGTPITYDEIGNPLTIGSKSLEWTGRQLQSISDDENNISYTYNGDGLRTSKTVNGETTNYYYNGSILAGQKSGDDTLVFMYDNNSDIFGFIYNDTEYYYIKNAQNDVIAIADANGEVLVKYTYDAWGKVISITDKDGNPIDDSVGVDAHIDPQTDEPTTTVGDDVLDVPSNTDEPTTVENSQNDESTTVGVDALIDPTNANNTENIDEPTTEPVTEEPTTTTDPDSSTTVDPQIAKIAHINPILYRSYYYDKETEWYYLNTRYYSPDMCRFVNGDGQINSDTLGNNLFSYCSNNPITREDKQGKGWWIPVATVVGGLISTAGRIASNISTGKKWYSGCGGAFLGGAVAGFLTACGHPVAGAFTGAFVESAVNERISYSKYAKYNGSKRKKNTRKNRINSYIKIGRDTLVGGAIGVLTGKLSNKIVKVNPGWIKPEKLSTCLTGNYAKKTFAQLGSEECMNGVMDIVGNGFAIGFNDGQEPILELYPTEYEEDNAP